MMKPILVLSLLAPLAAIPAAAQDRAPGGALGGAAAGAAGGAIIGGPVGAAVGGIGGAIVGGTLGGLSEPDRRYVVTYVQRNPRSSVRMENVAVGASLPRNVRIYRIEGRPSIRYSYAYVNGRPVIVEPSSRRVVQIIE
mgnify:CR=1 FL=1|jgi:predicted lipid-binding transport protein (Tim44 family)